jgi:hypothetical protein
LFSTTAQITTTSDPLPIAVASAFFDRVTGIEVRIASIGVEIPVWFLGDPSAIKTRRLWRGSLRGWSLTPGPLTGGQRSLNSGFELLDT